MNHFKKLSIKGSSDKVNVEELKELDVKYRQLERIPEAKREEVLRMFGEFNSFEQIKHHVIKTQGENAMLNDLGMIERLCRDPRHKFLVMRFRDQYLSHLKDVSLFHKRVRLDDLQYLRDRYLMQIKELDDHDVKHRSEFRFMASGLAQILSTVRDEVEGKGMQINVGLGIFDMGDLDGKSDDELISRREELLKKAQRAIGSPSGRRTPGDNGNTEDVIEATVSKPS